MHGARNDRRGFTLIELLVVMAVIAVFLGVLGMALSRGNPTVATQGGQRILAGLVTGARGQAILNQTEVRLIVHCDPPLATDSPAVQQEKRERYLRFIGIVVRDPNLGWIPVNEGVYLPRGIYLVPPDGLPATLLPTNPAVIPASDDDWLFARRSRLATAGGLPVTNTYVFNSEHPAQTYLHIAFNGRGMITSSFGGHDGRLIVAPARETPTTPRFEAGGDSYVLGGVLRSYGSLTLVSEPAAFYIDPDDEM